jgi:aerobic carbon-monoxide dehydrogenase medium subunit
MKPVAFEYERPSSIDAAVSLLTEQNVLAKVLAGSQSLGPMLNLRLAQPDLLIDITSINELTEVTEARDDVEIGACVTHADIEDGRVPDSAKGLLRSVAGTIAYRAVRNRGTLGGSLAHADPAADWVSVLPLLDAQIVTSFKRGNRTIAASEFVISSFTTALRPDELIRAVRIPKLSGRVRWGVEKITQKAGEFAHAIGAVLHDPERNLFRAVIGAIETAPIVVADATALFAGPFGRDLADRLNTDIVHRLLDEKGVTDPYIRQLAPVALRRAARKASTA